MNLWESWYRDYQASTSVDQELVENLSVWSARFARFFVLGGYARNQAPFPILPHEALTLLGFVHRDGMDVESLINLAQEYTNDGQIQIPVQWLAEPEEIARIHTAWAHDLLHEEEPEVFWLTARDDLDSLPADERICWLLDAAEFILEMSLLSDETTRIRVDTWSKLLYGDRMLHASATLLVGQAGAAVARHQHQQTYPGESRSFAQALVACCRADQLDVGNTLIFGSTVEEEQAELLARTLGLGAAAEQELAGLLERLFVSLGQERVSSTYLSDTGKWLEGILQSAQILFATEKEDEQIRGTTLQDLARHLEQSTVLARVDSLLSADQQASIRSWAADSFNR